MFDVGCSMLDVRCWMFDVGCSMFLQQVIPFANSRSLPPYHPRAAAANFSGMIASSRRQGGGRKVAELLGFQESRARTRGNGNDDRGRGGRR
jgi:hypothetical protein